MDLISSLTPYLALFSFLVSCTLGLHCLFERLHRAYRRKSNNRSQQRDRDTLPIHHQHHQPSSPSISLLEVSPRPPSVLLLGMTSHRTGQVPNMQNTIPALSRPHTRVESQAPRLDSACLARAVQKPIELPSEGFQRVNTTWCGPRHEQGLDG